MKHPVSFWDHFYIGGEHAAPAATECLSVIDATTEELAGSIPLATPADIDRAVGAARSALSSGSWPTFSPADRTDLLLKLAEAIERRTESIATTISAENGVPLWITRSMHGCDRLQAFAKIASEVQWEELRAGFDGPGLVRREPVGVAALIIPWNSPFRLLIQKLAPALAAGCTVVVKPAPETPLDAYYLAEAIDEAGIPPGVVNIVAGGREVGEYLIRHPGVDKVSFTGSSASGQAVASACGEQMKRFTMELGGKSAAVILDDADLDAALPLIANAYTLNNGQACTALTRILAPRSLYTDIVERLTALTSSLIVGDPFDPATQVGPVVSQRQQERVLGYFDIARNEGAKVSTGGGRPPGISRGWFVQPTLIYDADNSMRIAREEIFGPAGVVVPVDNEEHAIAIANDSPFGLSGSVFTADVSHGTDVARRISSGTVGVNVFRTDAGLPFGGVRLSGIGRELGPEGLDEYTELKSIYLPN